MEDAFENNINHSQSIYTLKINNVYEETVSSVRTLTQVIEMLTYKIKLK